jgi:hypothetical protein
VIALARKASSQNGHSRLEEAMAMLIQNQTSFVAQLADYNRVHSELEREHLALKRQSDERFARIEAQMAEIIRVLNEHTRVLERLPEAIREKIGFKGQP